MPLFKLIPQAKAREYAEYIANNQEMYPNEMKITDISTWEDEIKSTPYSVGMYFNNCVLKHIIGWRIFKREAEKLLYVSDLSILPAYQVLGYAKELVKFSLRETRWHKEKIHSYLRKTSYHIVANPILITSAGYEIIKDCFQPHHYYKRFGLAEDAHELIIAPI